MPEQPTPPLAKVIVTALVPVDGGYAPVNPPEWIAKLRPQVVLLSVAPDDQEGWIQLTTDGEGMGVEVERK